MYFHFIDYKIRKHINRKKRYIFLQIISREHLYNLITFTGIKYHLINEMKSNLRENKCVRLSHSSLNLSKISGKNPKYFMRFPTILMEPILHFLCLAAK